MKRFTSFLVALFLATAAMWAYDFKAGDLYYTITSRQSPSTVEVSKQNSSGYNYRGLTAIAIPESVVYEDITYAVTAIGDNAFEGCKTLTSVSIPESIGTIGEKAFYGCYGLTEVTIPENVMYIGRDAFHSTGITSVVWNAKNSTYGRYYVNETPFSSDVTSFTFGDKVEVIPATLCYQMSKLTKIIIPDNVTSIEDGAFSGCTSLTSVTIPKGVTHMGPSIFSGCTNITTVNWNAVNCELSGHTYIGSLCHPFYDCRKAITSFTFGEGVETIPDYMCTDMVALTRLELPATLKHIGYSAFSGCKSLEEIELPAALESIDDYAFNNCTGLLPLNIPDNVSAIGKNAFYGCSGITSLTIGKAVTTIGASAFEGCSGLFSVTWNARTCQDFSSSTASPFGKINTGIVLFAFGDEVENIPDYLCYGMSNVLSVELPNVLKRIGRRAFYQCAGLESADLPEGLVEIDEYAFYGCTSLTSVTLPTTLRNIEQSAYSNCSSIAVLNIQEGIEMIGERAFAQCPKIGAVTIPQSVKRIGAAVFQGDSKLQSVEWNVPTHTGFTESTSPFYRGNSNYPILTSFTFGSGVQGIPAYLCYKQRRLKAVTIPDNVLTIGDYAFSGCDSLAGMHIGANVREIGLYAIHSTLWYKNWWAAQDDGVAYINSVLMGYHGTMPANTTVKVKKWTTCIASHAFYNEKNLAAISIPATVTSIGDYAFSHCTGLTSCIITGNIKRVGKDAFWDCKNITSLTIAEGVDSIGSSAFAGCEGLTSVVIPSTLKTIEACVFMDCKGLTSVTISEGVQTIKDRAFLRCTGLTSITIPSTVENCESNICPDCTGLTSVIWNAKRCSDFGYSKYKGEKGPFASLYAQITSFTFGDGVEKIPSGICQYFTALPSVTIPESVTCIGGDAFYGCSKLRKITVPVNVDSVGYDAFYASGLQQVVWNARACKDMVLAYSDPRYFSSEAPIVSFTFGKEVERIPAALCEGRSKLVSVVIPNSVQEIGKRAFMDCTTLNKLTLGSGLKTIEKYAFSGCAALKSVIIPDSVETMEYAAFGSCTKLATLTIGKNVQNMDGSAFYGCSAITSVVWNAKQCNDFDMSNGEGLYSPFSSAREQITEVTFGTEVQSIPAQLFAKMTKLPSVNIPSSVIRIGNNAFYNNKALASVTMEDGTGELDIQEKAFYYCPALSRITLGHTTTIGNYAFGSCSSIETLTLPANLTYIGQSAFEDCDKIARVVIPDKVTTIREKAFYEIDSLRFVSVGESVRTIEGGGSYHYAFGAYGSIKEVEWNAIHCRDVNSAIFGSTDQMNKFTFGDKVERIPANLCAGMSGIDSINLPATLKSIGEYAFSSCKGVKKIILGENMKHIEYCAFNNCRGIDTIVTEAVVPPLCDTLAFKMNSFSGYTKTPVLVPCGSLEVYASASEWQKFGNLKEPASEFVLTLQTENETHGSVAFNEPIGCSNTATVSATPKSGYSFVQWNDGNTDNPRTLTITRNTVLTAQFSSHKCTITATAEHGVVNGTGTYDYGTTIALTAIADEHYHFTRWTDGNTDNPRKIMVEGDATYTAEFALDQHTITTDAHNGTITGGGMYDYGTTIALTAIAAEHYHFTRWTDGNTDNPRKIMVEGDATYTAEFALDQHTITTDAHNGTITGGGMYDYGTTIALTAIAAEHYHFTRWTDGNTDNPRKIMVEGDATYTAEFALDQHTITTDAHNGTITGGGMYDYGTTIALTAIAAEHYHFTRWTDGNTDNPRKIMVEGDATYTAEFALDQHTITTDAHNGTITGGGMYDYGTTIALTAIAAEHYHFTRWTDGNTDNPRKIMVEGDVTYTAEFALDQHTITVFCDPQQGAVTGAGTYDYGTQVTLTAIANEGCGFKQWSNGVADNPYTLTVTEDLTLEALFTSPTTAVENMSADNSAPQKVFRDGQVYILRNGKTYTLTGEDVE